MHGRWVGQEFDYRRQKESFNNWSHRRMLEPLLLLLLLLLLEVPSCFKHLLLFSCSKLPDTQKHLKHFVTYLELILERGVLVERSLAAIDQLFLCRPHGLRMHDCTGGWHMAACLSNCYSTVADMLDLEIPRRGQKPVPSIRYHPDSA